MSKQEIPEQGKPSITGHTEIRLENAIRLLKRLKRDLDIYVKAATEFSLGHHLDAARSLQRSSGLHGRLQKSLEAALETFQEAPLESAVYEAAGLARLHYRETLEKNLEQAKISHSMEWPSYLIADIIRLDIDMEKGVASIDGQTLRTFEPSKVVEEARIRVAALVERQFDSGEFLSRLKTAYDDCLTQTGESFDDYVDIRKVFSHLNALMRKSRLDTRYSTGKFGADLYRLFRDRKTRTSDGLALELSPAQDASGGLFVPGPGGGSYVAAIRFASPHQ